MESTNGVKRASLHLHTLGLTVSLHFFEACVKLANVQNGLTEYAYATRGRPAFAQTSSEMPHVISGSFTMRASWRRSMHWSM